MAGKNKGQLDQQLLSPDFFENPYPVYHQLRTEDAVHWCEPWNETLSRYHDADCLRVLANWADSAAMMRPSVHPKRRKEHRQPGCLKGRGPKGPRAENVKPI